MRQNEPHGWHCNEPEVEFGKYWLAHVVHCVAEEQVAQLLEHGREMAWRIGRRVRNMMEYGIIIIFVIFIIWNKANLSLMLKYY